MKLLPSQKNAVVQAIKTVGFDLKSFSFDEPNSLSGSTTVSYEDTSFYFSFMSSNFSKYTSKFSPGEDQWEEIHYLESWEEQLSSFIDWLTFLRREDEAIDKWKLIEEEMNSVFSDHFDDTDNSKFTKDEYKFLSIKLEELKDKISKLELLEEQVSQINEKLDHLLELAKNMNKVDWKNLFIGTLFSLIPQLSVDTNTGRAILELAKGLFQKVFLIK